MGLAGEISNIESNASGEQEITLKPATLAELVKENSLAIKDLTLSADNFLGVIAPSAVRNASLAQKRKPTALATGAKSALGGAVIVHGSNQGKKLQGKGFLGEDGSVDVGKVSLSLPIISLGKIVDELNTVKPSASPAEAAIVVEGSLNNLTLTGIHELKDGKLEALDLSLSANFSAEAKLDGEAKFVAGYFSQAWKEVNTEGFEKFGIKTELSGLNSSDKIGNYPLVGLVYSLPCPPPSGCPATIGSTQTPLRQAKAGGVILWIYVVLRGEASIEGEIGTRTNLDFKIGIGLDDDGKLVNKSEITGPDSGRMIEAPHIDGELGFEGRFGLGVSLDLFALGVRPASISTDFVGRIKGSIGTETGTVASYGITKQGDPARWEGGRVCLKSSLGAGAIISAAARFGVSIETRWGDPSGAFEYSLQLPTDEQMDEAGWSALWYTLAAKEVCYPPKTPTGAMVLLLENSNEVTWRQETRYANIYRRDASGELVALKLNLDLGEPAANGDYIGYYIHEGGGVTSNTTYVLSATTDDQQYVSQSSSGTAPLGLTIATEMGVNTLEWSNALSASRFDIAYTQQAIVETNREFTIVENVTSPYQHTNIGSEEVWYYRLRHVDESGVVSPWSAERAVVSEKLLELLAPQNVEAAAGNKQLQLSWDEVPNAESYNLYYATASGVNPQNYSQVPNGQAVSGISSPYQLNGLVNGQTYYLVVTAVSSDAEGPISSELSTTPKALITPIATSGALNDTGITQCADGSTNGLSCPVADYPSQDAQFGRDFHDNDDSNGHAGFSFTKLDANGDQLLANATSWSCVQDNVTGLIWEVKQGGNGTRGDEGLHDADDTYNWYSTDASNNRGLCGF